MNAKDVIFLIGIAMGLLCGFSLGYGCGYIAGVRWCTKRLDEDLALPPSHGETP